jgi:hypothetical protein
MLKYVLNIRIIDILMPECMHSQHCIMGLARWWTFGETGMKFIGLASLNIIDSTRNWNIYYLYTILQCNLCLWCIERKKKKTFLLQTLTRIQVLSWPSGCSRFSIIVSINHDSLQLLFFYMCGENRSTGESPVSI